MDVRRGEGEEMGAQEVNSQSCSSLPTDLFAQPSESKS